MFPAFLFVIFAPFRIFAGQIYKIVTSLYSFLLEKTRKGLVLFIKKFVLPPAGDRPLYTRLDAPNGRLYPLWTAFASFSPFQKKLFYFFAIFAGVSVLGLLFSLNNYFLVEVPKRGGAITEGVIGTPRFANPLLAVSDTDRDLSALVYSGLMRATAGGELVPDLAENYTVSGDGLTYTFVLKGDLTWHDGTPVTADDVVFTITKAKDSLLKSPKRANWEGVAIKKVNERTIELVLPRPYSPFLENTASLGILPEHIWGKVSVEQFGFAKFNVVPVGSGPYKVEELHTDNSGIPVYYDLVPFRKFALGSPYIARIRLRFYANEGELIAALAGGEIEAINAVTPKKAAEFARTRNYAIETYRLPRVFGVFLNQNQNAIFAQKAVREALAAAVDREAIVATVLDGFGTALRGPLPPGALGFSEEKDTGADTKIKPNLKEAALAILKAAGWKPDEKTGVMKRQMKKGTDVLAFSLAVPDTEELRAAAEVVKKQWEAVGAQVTLRVFDQGDLHQNIIRPRKYDSLFFGEIIGRESDPFAFWHSSQRNDPGLNIALYANITVDDLLNKGRTVLPKDERIALYQKFEEEIRKDIPAVFVYSPDFLYIHPPRIRGMASGTITVPSERFLDVYAWFIETDKVWRIFK